MPKSPEDLLEDSIKVQQDLLRLTGTLEKLITDAQAVIAVGSLTIE